MLKSTPISHSLLPFVLLALVCLCMTPKSGEAAPVEKRGQKVLLIGSSSMKGVIGMALEDAFEPWPSVEVIKVAQSATGLARPDYFDWVKKARELSKTHQPDVVVCNLGPNDGQSLREGKDWHYWGTDRWRELYLERVAQIIETFPDAHFIWLGPPAMKKENTSMRQALLSLFIRSVVRSYPNATFVDLFAMTSNSRGEYINTIVNPNGKTVKARSGDGVHFKFPAARAFARRVIAEAIPALGLELP